MVSNILERRKWTGSDVQYSGMEGADRLWCPIFWKGGSGLAMMSNILAGRDWTDSGVHHFGREGVDLQ